MNDKILKKGLVIGIIVLLGGMSLMPLVGSLSIEKYVSIASPYSIDLFCDEPYKNVKQGDTATYIVEIINTGTLDDTYDVIAGSIEDIVCKVNGVNADQFNPYEFTLRSGESKTFEITAEVWESVPIGEWSILIEGRSQNNTEVYDELILTANVQKKNRVISDSENDYDCQFLSEQDNVRFERLLVRLENSLRMLLLVSGDNPEITYKCQEMLEVINSDGPWDTFCEKFLNLFLSLVEWRDSLPEWMIYLRLFVTVTILFPIEVMWLALCGL